MKHAWIVLTLLLLGMQRGWAADCPPGTQLQVIGTPAGATVGTVQISSTGHQVRASRVSVGSTAASSVLYDADSNADATPTGTGYVDGNAREEPGAPANESRWTTYEPPLAFVNGISAHVTSNINGVFLYECR